MSESDLALGRRWVRSVESENIAGLTELADAAAEEVYEMWFADDFMEIAQPYKDNTYALDDEAWQAFSQNVVTRPYAQQLDHSEKRRMISALNGTVSWVYTSELVTDGLWDQVLPTRMGRADILSRYVLSGAAGDALAESDPELLRSAEQFANTPFRQRVLVGAAAVYGYHANYHRSDLQGSYRALDKEGLIEWHTYIGGSMHGDFRTSRSARPVRAISDTASVSEAHHFMPALYETESASYHGSEKEITASLLHYLVVNNGSDPETLRKRLFESLKGKAISTGGAYADYGDADGQLQANLLAYRVSHSTTGQGNHLYSSIIDPDMSARFQLTAAEDGVDFSIIDGDETIQNMHLPSAEIEAYITTMITANGGRVSPQALVRIIDGLAKVSR